MNRVKRKGFIKAPLQKCAAGIMHVARAVKGHSSCYSSLYGNHSLDFRKDHFNVRCFVHAEVEGEVGDGAKENK